MRGSGTIEDDRRTLSCKLLKSFAVPASGLGPTASLPAKIILTSGPKSAAFSAATIMICGIFNLFSQSQNISQPLYLQLFGAHWCIVNNSTTLSQM